MTKLKHIIISEEVYYIPPSDGAINSEEIVISIDELVSKKMYPYSFYIDVATPEMISGKFGPSSLITPCNFRYFIELKGSTNLLKVRSNLF